MPNALKHKPFAFAMIQDSDSRLSVWTASTRMDIWERLERHKPHMYKLTNPKHTCKLTGKGVAEQVLFISRRLPCFKWIGRHGADYIQHPDKTLSSSTWVGVLHVGFLCVRVGRPRVEPLRLWLYGWLCSQTLFWDCTAKIRAVHMTYHSSDSRELRCHMLKSMQHNKLLNKLRDI